MELTAIVKAVGKCFHFPPSARKIVLAMKLTVILVLVGVLQVSAKSYSQNVTISGSNLTLRKVFTEIRKQTGYAFVFEKDLVDKAKPVTLNLVNAPLSEVLNKVLPAGQFEYTIANGVIGVKERLMSYIPEEIPKQDTTKPLTVAGIITDSLGQPLEGANVVLKGTGRFARTASDGSFQIEGAIGQTLLISYVGHKSREIKISREMSRTIVLSVISKGMSEIVVSTGMSRNLKETYTGATAVYTGDELRKVSNKNVLESLKSLDPSFIVVENNLQGSNPNALPTIEIRGKTSIATTEQLNDQFAQDPNQPLFILNGFESTLEIIFNLDINRILTITILKDAAGTALYGSRAANGVVVVETLRPKAGELQIGYTMGLNIQPPDLSSYNLMNAAEKLEFERLTGVYRTNRADMTQYSYDQLYNSKLAEVQRGVNTYWIKQPLRTGVTNNHSIRINGGSNEFQFGVGASYTKNDGAMKMSGRRTWGSNVDLNYRKNKININSMLLVSGSKSEDSPYGSLGNFANANPYYRMYDSTGRIAPYLQVPGVTAALEGYTVANPLYEGTLNSYNTNKNFSIQEQLAINWDVMAGLQISASGMIRLAKSEAEVFRAPESSFFENMNAQQKGLYSNTIYNSNSYQGNISAIYGKLINRNHQVNFMVRGEVGETSNRNQSYAAVGFPFGTNGNPSYAFQYPEGSRPNAFKIVRRTNAGIASGSYTYKMRYFINGTYRIDGTTAFGSAEKFKNFWSLGLGWNLHNEKYFQQFNWINTLRLRGTLGVVGNANMGVYSSTSVYTFLFGSTRFGQGLDMTALGNPFLEWQNTRNLSLGTDVVLFNQRLSAELNYYEKNTDPLIVKAEGTLPSSVGIPGTYPVNVGKLESKGWEVRLRYTIIQNLAKRFNWSVGVTGANVKQTYREFGNSLEKLNQAQLDSRGLIRYTDGYSPDDIWAVRSLGIDPATGFEVFLTKDGEITYTYNTNDIVKVGNMRPKIEGVINSSFTYKAFSLSVFMRYQLGGYVMNEALFQKVENMDGTKLRNNQDKRALYGRWKEPGDVAQFKAIDGRSAQNGNPTSTPVSTRFIKKESKLLGESLNAQYTFRSARWIKSVGLKNLSLGFTANELFRLEKMMTERGTDYPFARTFTLTINANF